MPTADSARRIAQRITSYLGVGRTAASSREEEGAANIAPDSAADRLAHDNVAGAENGAPAAGASDGAPTGQHSEPAATTAPAAWPDTEEGGVGKVQLPIENTDEPGQGSPYPLAPSDMAPRGVSWQALANALPDPIMVLDLDGTLLHRSPGVADLFPRARVGHPMTTATRNPELLEGIDHVLSHGGPHIITLDERVPVMRRLSAIVSTITGGVRRPGEPAVLIVFRDLTEQERHNQMRADFVANASHELRTPLASLRGFIETLQGPARDDGPARDRFLAMMAAQAMRMSRLIDDLLALSRVEMREHLAPAGEVDMGELVRFVVQSLQPLTEASGSEVVVREAATPIYVRGERDELTQVLQNLLQNALIYGRTNGRVEIEVGRQTATGLIARTRAAVTVRDDGPGIAEEHLPRLTERFYRVSTTASRAKGGTGLGLAIVKHIVARHRGELLIRSKPGAGAAFTVLLDEIAPTSSKST